MNKGGDEYPWYATIEGKSSLAQGDLLDGFPILALPDLKADELIERAKNARHEKFRVGSDYDLYDLVVVTQTCDFLKFKDADPVIMCPRWDYREYEHKGGGLNWGWLIRGKYVSFHPLNRCIIDDHKFDYQIVDLRTIFAVRFSFVRQFAELQEERIRLLPPYREHLGQAFARQFMRVGLPIDLPREV